MLFRSWNCDRKSLSPSSHWDACSLLVPDRDNLAVASMVDKPAALVSNRWNNDSWDSSIHSCQFRSGTGMLELLFCEPGFIEFRMLHALSSIDEVAVDGVDSTVRALDDGGVVEGAGRFIFQVLRLGPVLAFIGG